MSEPNAWSSGRRPGLLGRALMLYAVDVDEVDLARFRAWYDHEHLPERVAVPGFLRGRRYVRVSGPGQQHLTLYDAVNTAVFSSPEYLARLDDPTPLTRSVVATFRRPYRAVLSVEFSVGAAVGAQLAVLTLPPAPRLRNWVADSLAPALLTHPDLCGLHLGASDAAATAAKSATAEGRDAAEQSDERCVLLIDGVRDVSELARRAVDLCHAAGLADADAEPTIYGYVTSLLS